MVVTKRERLEAELALLELEEAFVEKKLAGKLTMEDRLELREAEAAFRANRQVVAQPATINGVVQVGDADAEEEEDD